MQRLSFVDQSMRLTLLLLVTAAGCLRPRDDMAVAAYLPRPVPGQSVDAGARPFAIVERALRLPAFSNVSLPAQSRELRMSTSFSMLGPANGIRVVEEPGRVSSGFLVHVWSERSADSTRPVPQSRCTAWQSGIRDCALVWRHAYDWGRVAANLDSLRVWDLTAPCDTDGRSFADAGDLYLDRLRGPSSDTYACNAPRFRSSASAAQATRLLNYLDSLARLASTLPPDPPEQPGS
jgi:hypothetical protein